MNLFIVGLRRSGTTAFWSAFRQASHLHSYNEPFNPVIRDIGVPQWVNLVTYREMLELHDRDPGAFWETFRSIYGIEELQWGLSDTQAAWLRYLLSSADQVNIDFTRCHFKIADLAKIDPGAVVVHLYRPPRNYATSILLPSGLLERVREPLVRSWRTIRRDLGNALRRRRFWTTESGYSRGYETVIGRSPASLFGLRLTEAGLDPDSVFQMPTVGRLLALWKVMYERVEEDGPRLFGERFLSVNFHDFCRNPMEAVRRVYRLFGEEIPRELDLTRVHSPKPPFAPSDSRWRYYEKQLSLPTDLE